MKEMPAEDDREQQCAALALSEVYIDREWLIKELLLDKNRIIILDCRSSNEFGESHVRNAVNFSIPSIMLRRLAAGKIDRSGCYYYYSESESEQNEQHKQRYSLLIAARDNNRRRRLRQENRQSQTKIHTKPIRMLDRQEARGNAITH